MPVLQKGTTMDGVFAAKKNARQALKTCRALKINKLSAEIIFFIFLLFRFRCFTG